jgi:excinuclease ABC subunit C
VRAAARIEWEVCPTELDAALTEVRLIQALRPVRNVAGAFPFLYPFVGLRVETGETAFCLTTSPRALPGFALHGAFRSRQVTGEAFFALRRLLGHVGHPVSPARRRRLGTARYTHVAAFRRLPAGPGAAWGALLQGTSREALEWLALALLEHPGARARASAVQADLRAVGRFFEEEAGPLARARTATGYGRYPVPQEERDLLLLRYRSGPAAP